MPRMMTGVSMKAEGLPVSSSLGGSYATWTSVRRFKLCWRSSPSHVGALQTPSTQREAILALRHRKIWKPPLSYPVRRPLRLALGPAEPRAAGAVEAYGALNMKAMRPRDTHGFSG